MKKLALFLCVLFSISSPGIYAQDTLPKFSVRNVGNNRIILGWTNTFETIKQISIQRSFDSTKNFRTILTVADPTTPQNGFADTKAPNDHMFYRLFILLEKGVYLFSDVKKPVLDTMKKVVINDNVNTEPANIDSIIVPNFGVTNGKPKPEIFTPSLHVFTHKDGYVSINLPDEEDKKYSIKFYEEDETFLFELKNLKERTFKIDKANFYHAGWFRFELFEDGKLIEKHKFYLRKDF